MIDNHNLKKFVLPAFLLLIVSCSTAKQTPDVGFYEPKNISQKVVKKTGEKTLVERDKSGFYVPKDKKTASTSKPNRFFVPKKDLINNAETLYAPIIGEASWYGPGFHGKKTANGEIYDENKLTAAHRTLPLGSTVKVINLKNNKSVVVRINDRGPFVGDRVLDGSKRVAELLDYKNQGTTRVKILVLQAPKSGINPVKSVLANNKNTQPKLSLGVQQAANNFPKVSPPRAISVDSHVVQVGSFSVQHNANKFKNTLAGKYANFPFLINLSKGKYFQVLVGPFNSKAKAQHVADMFSKAGIDNLVRYYGNI